jgi:hypothetical protein
MVGTIAPGGGSRNYLQEKLQRLGYTPDQLRRLDQQGISQLLAKDLAATQKQIDQDYGLADKL